MDEDRSRPLGNPFVARTLRWGIVAWSTIGVLILGYILFRFVLYPIRIIFPPLVVAMIAVYLLNPIVTRLERRGLKRIWGALLVYLVFASLVGTAMYFLIPTVAEQVSDFVRAAPRIVGDAVRWFRDLADRFGVQIGGGAAPSPDSVVDVLGRVFSVTRGLLDVALVLVLGPILAFYLVVDLPKIKRNLRAMIPSRRRREVDSVTEKIGRAIGSYFRGQLLVAAFVAVASSFALWIVGLPFWAVVGLVTGLFNLVPLIGPFIGAAVAIFIALTTDQTGGLLALDPGWPLAVGSAAALLVVQQIDNHIISPNMIGRTVRLHPVTVMLGLLVGGALLGLWGMLLAIPVIATIKILILHAWDTRMTWPPPSGTEQRQTLDREPAPVPSAEGGSPVPQRGRRPPAWWTAVRAVLAGRRAPPRSGTQAVPTEDVTEPSRPIPADQPVSSGPQGPDGGVDQAEPAEAPRAPSS